MDDIRPALHNYCLLMEGIKFRTDLMLELIRDQHGLPSFCIAEVLNLQVRMICETLAIACLVAHRNIEGSQSARLQSAYQADLIMNALEKLHPRFFPRPHKQILKDGKPYEIRDIKDGFLTKEQLLKSYWAAAEALHAGAVSKLTSDKPKILDLQYFWNWIQGLVVLLDQHSMFLADEPDSWEGKEPLKFKDGEPAPKRYIAVQMKTGPYDRPAAALFETVGLQPPSVE